MRAMKCSGIPGTSRSTIPRPPPVPPRPLIGPHAIDEGAREELLDGDLDVSGASTVDVPPRKTARPTTSGRAPRSVCSSSKTIVSSVRGSACWSIIAGRG